jgi:hypothetical protein
LIASGVVFAGLAAISTNGGVYALLAVLAGLAFMGLLIVSRFERMECQIAEQTRLQSLNAMNLASELHSMLVILERFPACTLPTTSWSMRFSNLHKIMEILDERQPLTIVEFGSGLSTILIASWLDCLGRGKLISYDHDSNWADATKNHLRMHNLEDFAEVRHAPLKEIECDGQRVVWYNLDDQISDIAEIDLMIVDGPPASASANGLSRLPAFFQFRNQFSPNHAIVLDDANRPGEQAIVEKWMQFLPHCCSYTHTGLTSLSVICSRKRLGALKSTAI